MAEEKAVFDHVNATWENGIAHDKHGYWWRDETEDMYGPYTEKKDAEIAAKAYGKWLSGGDQW